MRRRPPPAVHLAVLLAAGTGAVAAPATAAPARPAAAAAPAAGTSDAPACTAQLMVRTWPACHAPRAALGGPDHGGQG